MECKMLPLQDLDSSMRHENFRTMNLNQFQKLISQAN